MKESNKLYQTMTPKEIVNDLQVFIEYFKKEQKRIPLCMEAAQEYIVLNEEKHEKK